MDWPYWSSTPSNYPCIQSITVSSRSTTSVSSWPTITKLPLEMCSSWSGMDWCHSSIFTTSFSSWCFPWDRMLTFCWGKMLTLTLTLSWECIGWPSSLIRSLYSWTCSTWFSLQLSPDVCLFFSNWSVSLRLTCFIWFSVTFWCSILWQWLSGKCGEINLPTLGIFKYPWCIL